MNKKPINSEQAFEKVKAERAKKGLARGQIKAPKITGRAAANLIAEMKLREKTQAKAQSRSLNRVIR